jgi:type VI secretion system secreted protein Hcp
LSTQDSSKVDYFLKLDGIPGESKDASHRNEIDIYSWAFAAHRHRGVDGDGNQGRASLTDITVNKSLDKASTLIFQCCTQNKIIKSLVITCRKAGKDQQEYLVITGTGVYVTQSQYGGSNHEGLPTETVTLSFQVLELSYREQQADGGLAGPMKAQVDLTRP